MVRVFSFSLLSILFLIFFSMFFTYNYMNLWGNVEVYFFNYFWNFKYIFGMDSLSLLFLILSVVLLVVCLIWFWNLSYLSFFYNVCVFLALVALLQIFLTINVIYFFFFYEFIAVPMLFLISIWGSRERKLLAGNLLFIYTLFGSLFLLFSFFYIYMVCGSFNIIYINSLVFDEFTQKLMFLLIFIGFSIKVPIVPLHLWLPEAHVEASTPGSVLLAGIVLKLSVYAYIRLLFSLSIGWLFWMDLIILISIIGFYLPSFVALVQNDLKKIIAYSSVSHMNFALIGFFEKSILGIFGSVFMMFGHAIVASALFLSIGLIYERYKTRLIYYYGGLYSLMPLWSSFFFIFILGNFGFPGTVNFVGEFMIYFGVINYDFSLFIFSFLGMLLTLIYSLFMYVRVVKGYISLEFISYFCDFTRREFIIFFFFFIFSIFFGIFPNILIKTFVYTLMFLV